MPFCYNWSLVEGIEKMREVTSFPIVLFVILFRRSIQRSLSTQDALECIRGLSFQDHSPLVGPCIFTSFVEKFFTVMKQICCVNFDF